MKRTLTCVIVLSLGIGHVRGDSNSTDPPLYEVKRTEVAPTIDGSISEGEWETAAPAAGDWVGLIGHTPDEHNLRFRMLWDDEHLYVLGETDYARNASPGWSGFGEPKDFKTDDPESDPSVYVPRMIFDPNADGEDWSSPDFNPAEPDGYTIRWSMSEGFAERRPSPGAPNQDFRDPLDESGSIFVDYIPGFELEAHVNALSGNQGEWDLTDEGTDNYRDNKHPGIQFAQLAIDTPLDATEQPGGVFEFSIAWTEFNATDPNSENPLFDPESPEFLENGLYHPMAPQADDIWGFEIGVRDPEGTLPSWSEPLGGNEEREMFAGWQAPHGRLKFAVEFPEFDCNRSGEVDNGDLTCITAETRDPTLEILNLVHGDMDADGSVGFPDFLRLSLNFGQAVPDYTQGDLDIDGTVGFSDFLILSLNFGRTSADLTAAAVPEPHSLYLLVIGLLGLRRRRR